MRSVVRVPSKHKSQTFEAESDPMNLVPQLRYLRVQPVAFERPREPHLRRYVCVHGGSESLGGAL